MPDPVELLSAAGRPSWRTVSSCCRYTKRRPDPRPATPNRSAVPPGHAPRCPNPDPGSQASRNPHNIAMIVRCRGGARHVLDAGIGTASGRGFRHGTRRCSRRVLVASAITRVKDPTNGWPAPSRSRSKPEPTPITPGRIPRRYFAEASSSSFEQIADHGSEPAMSPATTAHEDTSTPVSRADHFARLGLRGRRRHRGGPPHLRGPRGVRHRWRSPQSRPRTPRRCSDIVSFEPPLRRIADRCGAARGLHTSPVRKPACTAPRSRSSRR